MLDIQYTPYLLPLIISAIISGGVVFCVWRRRAAPGAIPLGLLALSIAVWSLGYALEIGAVSLPAKMFWGKSQYFGIVVTPLAWAIFALQYTGQDKWLTRRNIGLAAIIPVMTLLLALTTERHGLIWREARLDETGYYQAMLITYGLWFWVVHLAYSYLLMLLGTLVVIRALVRTPGPYRGQGLALLVAALAPWLGNAIYLSGFNPVPLDLTPFAFTVTLIALAWGAFRFRLMDLTPVARDTVVENMGDGVLILDAQDRLVDFNPAAGRMLGLPAAQAIGRHVSEILPAWSRPVEPHRRDLPAGEVIAIGQGERRRELEVNISPLWDRKNRVLGLALTLRDITEQRRAKENLRQSEERYRRLVEHTPLAIAIHSQGKIVYINQAGVQMMGSSSQTDFIGRPALDFVHPDYRAAAVRRIQQTQAAGQISPPFEEKFITLDGRIIDVEVTAIPFDYEGQPASQVVIRDITEHKRAEAALRESEARNRAMLNALPDLIFVQSRESVYLDYHAPNPADLFVPPEEFLGRRMQDIFPEAFASPLLALFEQALATGRVQIYEYQLPIAGQLRHFEARIVPYGQDKVLSIVREITRRKALEAQLLQAQKMEAIGRLAGGIAHDFNNILVPIIGYVELGMMRLSPDDKLYADLQRVREAAERAASLTRQILAFSRKQVLEMRPVDLNEMLADFETMLRRLIGENIELRLFLAPALPPVRADRSQLEQVILNLAVNARDAMPQGGRLTLETDSLYLDEKYVEKRPEVQPDPYVMLAVSDTGHGIDAETQEHIFEPFFTTREQGQGTGLGLAMVHGIVKQHKGHIWVYSELGRGTTFKIYLPQATETTQPVQPAGIEPATLYGTETILVAEDEEMVRRLVVETLN